MMLGYSASSTRASQHEKAAKQDTVMVCWGLSGSLSRCRSKGLSQGDLQPYLSSWWFNSLFQGKAAKSPCVELESEFKLELQQ